ncbi:unnamed protein product [Urochloa humidicola]
MWISGSSFCCCARRGKGIGRSELDWERILARTEGGKLILPVRARDPCRRRLLAAAATTRAESSLSPWSTSSARRRARRRLGLDDARSGGLLQNFRAWRRPATARCTCPEYAHFEPDDPESKAQEAFEKGQYLAAANSCTMKHKKARDAFAEALKLDPSSKKIKKALGYYSWLLALLHSSN